MHLEIACDESGFSGGNLVGQGHSPVFAHASIRIDSDTASQLVQHLRSEIGARGEGEYKSAEILRPRRRPIVLWLFGPSTMGRRRGRRISADLYSPSPRAPISLRRCWTSWLAVSESIRMLAWANTGLCPLADQVAAREAGLVAGDLEMHDQLLPWQRD